MCMKLFRCYSIYVKIAKKKHYDETLSDRIENADLHFKDTISKYYE